MSEVRECVNIIGAGLAGISAALHLAEKGQYCRIFASQEPERAQSNLAEGGINACLNVMGENDRVSDHFADTMRGGCDLADPNMVAGLCLGAPGIIRKMQEYGVPFQRENGRLIQRNFGGQKKKRTTFVKSSTGKMLMAALIDALRKYECDGLVESYMHHDFCGLMTREKQCRGVIIQDRYRGTTERFYGPVIMACGGLNGFFGNTTGSTANTGNAAAILFSQGVEMGNLEMIQYHPTTIRIPGKRLLISEAARGEGGRLFYYNGERQKCYFLEEKYGASGNLMPRDVISREMALSGKEIFLDLTGLSEQIWKKKLNDLREELIHYLAVDPVTDVIPVSPGIHFFMGGIRIDEGHGTNIGGLFAAGECACGYHGANRLGGNSLLAAIYGGGRAAESAAACEIFTDGGNNGSTDNITESITDLSGIRKETEYRLGEVLCTSLGVLRSTEQMQKGLDAIRELQTECDERFLLSRKRLRLAEGILLSALARKESRGAHCVRDYKENKEEYRKSSIAGIYTDEVTIRFEMLPGIRNEYVQRMR